jgi:hypothetical protein
MVQFRPPFRVSSGNLSQHLQPSNSSLNGFPSLLYLCFGNVLNQYAASHPEILDAAGPRYQMHNPATWGAQAKFADEGRFDELKEYQDMLTGGRDLAE